MDGSTEYAERTQATKTEMTTWIAVESANLSRRRRQSETDKRQRSSVKDVQERPDKQRREGRRRRVRKNKRKKVP